MIEHAVKELPNECCGVLLGRNNTVERVVPMRSIPPSPGSYFMDPSQQVDVFTEMEKQGETLLGIYHSHPKGPLQPSGADLHLAFHPDAIYFIISLEDRENLKIGAFKLEQGKFKEIKIQYY